ncbi:MAG: nicotinamide riboside transporter PnuC [Prevotellaceae bacterium]|jgi:nicotinamide mononucleotide transporter|nr:nicotinamide riboside transporter PnuC [Prevotellaceae bacterium]
MSAILNYLSQNTLEIAGTVFSLIYIYLSVKEKIALWIFGILAAMCYAVVFFQSKIYAGLTLQMYYICISIYGFWNWKFGAGKDADSRLPVKKTKAKQWIIFAIAATLIFFAYFFVLKRFTDSTVPFGDSFATALCVVGAMMLAKKLLENWLIFIVADAFAVGLYLYQGLYLTACLFAVYSAMAVAGYLRWRAILNNR